jgi:hypothetical protein
VPGTSLIAFMPMSITFLTLYLTYWLLLLFFAGRQATPLNAKYFADRDGKIILYLLLLLLSLTILFISWRYAGFRMNFSLLNVYDLREEARNYDIPIILSYLQGMAKSVLPVMFVYFILRKNKLFSASVAFIIFINFSINGLKSTIFYLFLAIIGYYFFKGSKSIRWYVWALILISIAGILEYRRFDTSIISSMIVRRVEFVPIMLNYQYYDFFSNHEYDLFRQSFLRYLGFQSPYETDFSFMVGEQMGKPETRANNGLFSDAYANFGIIGIICFPFLLVLFMRLMNAYAIKMNERLLFIPIVATAISLMSTTFMTCLVTHGLIAILICMMAMGEKNINKK